MKRYLLTAGGISALFLALFLIPQMLWNRELDTLRESSYTYGRILPVEKSAVPWERLRDALYKIDFYGGEPQEVSPEPYIDGAQQLMEELCGLSDVQLPEMLTAPLTSGTLTAAVLKYPLYLADGECTELEFVFLTDEKDEYASLYRLGFEYESGLLICLEIISAEAPAMTDEEFAAFLTALERRTEEADIPFRYQAEQDGCWLNLYIETIYPEDQPRMRANGESGRIG